VTLARCALSPCNPTGSSIQFTWQSNLQDRQQRHCNGFGILTAAFGKMTLVCLWSVCLLEVVQSNPVAFVNAKQESSGQLVAIPKHAHHMPGAHDSRVPQLATTLPEVCLTCVAVKTKQPPGCRNSCGTVCGLLGVILDVGSSALYMRVQCKTPTAHPPPQPHAAFLPALLLSAQSVQSLTCAGLPPATFGAQGPSVSSSAPSCISTETQNTTSALRTLTQGSASKCLFQSGRSFCGVASIGRMYRRCSPWALVKGT